MTLTGHARQISTATARKRVGERHRSVRRDVHPDEPPSAVWWRSGEIEDRAHGLTHSGLGESAVINCDQCEGAGRSKQFIDGHTFVRARVRARRPRWVVGHRLVDSTPARRRRSRDGETLWGWPHIAARVTSGTRARRQQTEPQDGSEVIQVAGALRRVVQRALRLRGSFLRRIVLGLPSAGRSQRLIRHLVDCDATTCSYEA
jgi:hypothetical protein